MPEKKSNFSVTCSLLSQFLKEKRSLAELAVSGPQEPNKGLFRPPTPMSLFPGVDVSAEMETETDTKSMEFFPQQTGFGSADKKPEAKEQEKSQLTIFYGGKVLVFDDFPADKATDLVQLAAKGSSAAPSTAPALADRPPESCPSASGGKPVPVPAHPSPELHMPIARRASLHRFFAKRKYRIASKAPYQLNGNSSQVSDSGKTEETRSWLGLGPVHSNPNPNPNPNPNQREERDRKKFVIDARSSCSDHFG